MDQEDERIINEPRKCFSLVTATMLRHRSHDSPTVIVVQLMIKDAIMTVGLFLSLSITIMYNSFHAIFVYAAIEAGKRKLTLKF